MKRINKKIHFMRKMTSESESPAKISYPIASNESLFKFDKFYDHCLKNINKCLN